MCETMITEKDLKELRSYQTRNGKIKFWSFIAGSFIFLSIALLNLCSASKIGSLQGFNLVQIFRCWGEGINLDAQYSGIFIAVRDRLTISFSQIAVAIMILIFAYDHSRRSKLSKRILAFLKSEGLKC